MKRREFVAVLSSGLLAGTSMALDLDYDDLIILDAEALAEGGILSAYQALLPALEKHIPSPAPVKEIKDDDDPSYSVECQGVTYFIYGGDNQDESWGNATFALFDIVNRQLARTKYRLFAINGGNDLGGMWLTETEAAAAKRSLKNRKDWPYLPSAQGPWYGMFH
jgi:hypothetical protein